MPKWYFNEETEEFHGDALYFIQQGSGGPIKIGRGKCVNSRLVRLQTGNPEALYILGSLPTQGYTEAFWHSLFEEHRIRGEWFKSNRDLKRAIAAALRGEHWAYHANWRRTDGQPGEIGEALLDAYEIFQDMVFDGNSEKHSANEAVAISLARFLEDDEADAPPKDTTHDR